MAPSVLVILAQGFEEVEAITPIDLLRRSGARVTVAGLGDRMVQGSHALVVQADALLSDCMQKTYDCVVLPGGSKGAENLASSFEVLEMVIKCAQKGVVAAICAATAVVLGKTGLLDGKQVTGYPGTEAVCPGLILQPKKVVVDHNLITGQGPGAAMDFSLGIISTLFDATTADKIAQQIIYQR